VISIFSVLVGLSVPAMHHVLKRATFQRTCHRLLHVLYVAKAQAILKGETLILCGSDNGRTCDNHWQHFWLIKNLKTQSTMRRFDINLSRLIQVNWRGNHKQRVGIYFNALGETMGQQGRFIIKASHDGRSEIVISLSGRMRVVN